MEGSALGWWKGGTIIKLYYQGMLRNFGLVHNVYGLGMQAEAAKGVGFMALRVSPLCGLRGQRPLPHYLVLSLYTFTDIHTHTHAHLLELAVTRTESIWPYGHEGEAQRDERSRQMERERERERERARERDRESEREG